MKYILINDIFFFFKKYLKLNIVFFVTISAILIIQAIIGNIIDIGLLKGVVGLEYSLDKGLISTLMFLLNLCFHLILVFQLFENDSKNGIENILLRMSLSKWVFFKLLSLFIINNIIRVLVYVISVIIITILGASLSPEQIVNYYYINMLLIVFIDLVFLFLYSILNDKKKLSIIFIIVLLIFMNLNIFEFEFLLQQQYNLILIILILIIIFVFSVKKRYFNLFK